MGFNTAAASYFECSMLSVPSSLRSSRNDERLAAGTQPDMARSKEASQTHTRLKPRLLLSLTAMAFLWTASQIPIYLFGKYLSVFLYA
jgi:hypothetical protein